MAITAAVVIAVGLIDNPGPQQVALSPIEIAAAEIVAPETAPSESPEENGAASATEAEQVEETAEERPPRGRAARSGTQVDRARREVFPVETPSVMVASATDGDAPSAEESAPPIPPPAAASETADENPFDDDVPLAATVPSAARDVAPAANGELPERPTRAQVQAGMLSVRSAVQRCLGRGGRVPVRVVILGRTGSVQTAQVQDAFFARQPTGGCIARAVRGAEFPPFQQTRLTVVYPYEF